MENEELDDTYLFICKWRIERRIETRIRRRNNKCNKKISDIRR